MHCTILQCRIARIQVDISMYFLKLAVPSLSVSMAAVEMTEKVAGVRNVKNKFKVKIPKPA
jgi:hypothetical protein